MQTFLQDIFFRKAADRNVTEKEQPVRNLKKYCGPPNYADRQRQKPRSQSMQASGSSGPIEEGVLCGRSRPFPGDRFRSRGRTASNKPFNAQMLAFAATLL